MSLENPNGFRFNPTDSKLIKTVLKPKQQRPYSSSHPVIEVMWDLPVGTTNFS